MRRPVRTRAGLLLAVCSGHAVVVARADGWVSGLLHDLTGSSNSSASSGGATQNHTSISKRIGNMFGGIASEAKGLAGDLEQAGDDALKSMKDTDWLHWEDENKLEGHSKTFKNVLLLSLFCFVGIAAIIGHFLDEYLCPAHLKVGRRPRGWVFGVLVASYMLLIPAVQSTLFSFNIYMDLKIGRLGNLGYNLTREPITESMTSVIGLLFQTGGTTGAYCVILYAMILPTLKILLLAMGELWRNSDSEALQQVSSACILLVQVTSKWATPDLYAYILLLFLFRHLDHPPLVRSEAVLDVGFCCFGVFCLCSTFSTLAIHRPVIGKADMGQSPNAMEYGLVGQSQNAQGSPLLDKLGREGALLVVAALEILFFILLLAGVLTPCMGLHLETGMLLKPKGPVPRSMNWMLQDAIDALELRPMLRAEVSVWHCLTALASYVAQGEASCVMAFVMLAIFAVAITVADMVMLALATFAMGRPGPNTPLHAARVLKHISMLDVFCMGVFVVCLAGKAYASVGFNLGLRQGLLPLAAAELLHYATYHFVAGLSGESEEAGSGDESSLASEDKFSGRKDGY